MRARIIVSVVILSLTVGIGWYVTAQDSALPMFNDGDILFASDLNAIVQQVEANTDAINDTNGDELTLTATLSGAQEVVPTDGVVTDVLTDATGDVEATFDPGLTQVAVRLTVSAIDNVMRAHFHCARPGANGPIALGLFDPGPCSLPDAAGVTECTLSNENFQQPDCVPNIGRPVNNVASLFFAMRDGLIYANVHTTDVPAGEIRGQMMDD